MKRFYSVAVLVCIVICSLSSCGGDGNKGQNPGIAATTETATSHTDEPAPLEAGTSKTIRLEANDQMQYNLTELKVVAGEEVTLIFNHTGQIDKTTMGHNFVLLKSGTDIAAKAMRAADKEYILSQKTQISLPTLN